MLVYNLDSDHEHVQLSYVKYHGPLADNMHLLC